MNNPASAKASNPVDINSVIGILSAIYITVVGSSVFIVQPGFVQGLVTHYGFNEKLAGYITSAEMWGIAVTTLLITFISSQVNWRYLLTGSLVLVAAGNLASILTQDVIAFATIRFIAGVGFGGLISLGFTLIGLTANPDRNFGYLIMSVLTYGALGLWVMPTAFHYIGMDGVIIFFALLALTALPMIKYLPKSGHEHIDVNDDAVNLPPLPRSMAIIAMFIYFCGQGVVWAYLFLIGTQSGVAEQDVANGLTLSQFLGIAGALIAVVIGQKLGRILPLSIGIILGIIPLFYLLDEMNATVYAIAVCVYNFAWNMTHPFLLAAMASFDRTGAVVINAIAAQMLGLAIGPAVAASVVTANSYDNVISLGIIFFIFSLALIYIPVSAHKKLLGLQAASIPLVAD